MHGRFKSDAAIGFSLLFAVFLWGGNNTGTKLIVSSWPPVWTGGSRFFCAGLFLIGLLRWTGLLGSRSAAAATMSRQLWIRGGLSLAAYIVVFNSALRFTSASHVAVYLGASPVWALLWDSPPGWNRESLRRYGAAALALGGVLVLFWPALAHGSWTWIGESLAMAASVLWANYGRQCRVLGARLSGAESSAETMWRAGVLLLPIGVIEVWHGGLPLDSRVIWTQVYCIIAGGVIAFAIWSNALRHWPTSKVMLFNNLIPLSTMVWARFWLGERITGTFWVAMLLVVAGVLLGQVGVRPPSVPVRVGNSRIAG